ncbi:hypothetical protein LX36DRAFT_650479 [Colletotrichum falcatum]|nr:hypothetical protein LX36DRAFT_650479 [Colletotrichum falcatum]
MTGAGTTSDGRFIADWAREEEGCGRSDAATGVSDHRQCAARGLEAVAPLLSLFLSRTTNLRKRNPPRAKWPSQSRRLKRETKRSRQRWKVPSPSSFFPPPFPPLLSSQSWLRQHRSLRVLLLRAQRPPAPGRRSRQDGHPEAHCTSSALYIRPRARRA